MAHHKVDAVIAFLNAAHTTMGGTAAWPGIVQSQVHAIVDFVGSSPPTIVEASSALSSLAGPPASIVFSAGDRSAIATAITTSATASTPSALPTAPPQCSRAGNQTHFFMCNYMTEEDWTAILMQSVPSMKMKVLVERGLDIGLKYPSEKTMVSVVAIVIVASQTMLSSAECHTLLDQLKRMWKTTRQSKQSEQTCAHFPPAVADFEKTYPGRYAQDAPPVISRVSIALIEDLRSSLAARKTHRSLSAPVHQCIGHPQIPSLVMFPPKRAPNLHNPRLGLTVMPHAGIVAQRECLPLQDVVVHHRTSSVQSLESIGDQHSDDGATPAASSKMDNEPVSGSAMSGGIIAQVSSPEALHPPPTPPQALATPIAKKKVDTPAIVGNLDDLFKEFRDAASKHAALRKAATGEAPTVSAKTKGKCTARASPSTASTSCVAGEMGKRVCNDPPEAQPHKRRMNTKTKTAESCIALDSTPQLKAKVFATVTPSKSSKSSIAPTASIRCSATPVFSKPFVTHEWSRQQVLARTGCRGAGHSKAFKFDGKDSSQAWVRATEWLGGRCEELGIDWTPVTSSV